MVIKLEGGSDFDLTILDYPDNEDKKEDKRDKEKNRFWTSSTLNTNDLYAQYIIYHWHIFKEYFSNISKEPKLFSFSSIRVTKKCLNIQALNWLV